MRVDRYMDIILYRIIKKIKDSEDQIPELTPDEHIMLVMIYSKVQSADYWNSSEAQRSILQDLAGKLYFIRPRVIF